MSQHRSGIRCSGGRPFGAAIPRLGALLEVQLLSEFGVLSSSTGSWGWLHGTQNPQLEQLLERESGRCCFGFERRLFFNAHTKDR